MSIVICILSIWVFLKTLSYGLFEKKNNKIAGTIIIIISAISLIFPNLIIWLS